MGNPIPIVPNFDYIDRFLRFLLKENESIQLSVDQLILKKKVSIWSKLVLRPIRGVFLKPLLAIHYQSNKLLKNLVSLRHFSYHALVPKCEHFVSITSYLVWKRSVYIDWISAVHEYFSNNGINNQLSFSFFLVSPTDSLSVSECSLLCSCGKENGFVNS